MTIQSNAPQRNWWKIGGIGCLSLMGLFILFIGCTAIIGLSGSGGGGGAAGGGGDSPIANEEANPDSRPEAQEDQEPVPEKEQPAEDRFKEVRVEAQCASPCDVSISDSTFRVFREEQITGSKTYTFEVPKRAGMSVMVSDPEFRMNNDIHARVFEDGKLVSEDHDRSMATIEY